MTSTTPITGGCLCGAIELRLEPPTDFLAICHCRSCRVSHGAPMVAWTSVPEQRFALVKGEPHLRWYRSSPTIRWGFCDTCGTHLLYRADAPGHPESPRVDCIYVSAASLNGPLDRAVTSHVSYEERVSWYECGDALPKYRGKGVERIG